MSIAGELSDGRTEVPLRFTVPEQLHEIDLGEDQQQRVRRTFEKLIRCLHGIDQTKILAMVFSQEAMLAKLVQEGAVYVAQCVARSEFEPTRLCVAQFSILVKDAALQGAQPLKTIASGLRTPGEPREIIFMDFPAGEGLVIGEELAVQPYADVTGQRTGRSHRVRQAQIILAFPDRRRLAILNVSSEGIEDWHHLTRTLNEIAHSVSFTKRAENTISMRLNTLG
ncbi:hypothetical protein [Amycolatopsis palatopharyngis]|uniref:hypothetical protein n=1 Tax=Amycolatopsis palatopharyngis TaxID=187982 RepID=UPI0013BEA584|nr:hypothetical protein [Amycolatopsis palatopharyngis]